MYAVKRTCCLCRYSDMVHLFAKPVPVINMITNEVFTYIYATRRHRIQQLNYQLLRPRNLKYYAVVVHRKGAPLDNCFGFVDGTVRPISRPECNQRIVYNDAPITTEHHDHSTSSPEFAVVVVAKKPLEVFASDLVAMPCLQS